MGIVLGLVACKGPEEGTTYIGGTYNGVLAASVPQAVEATVDALEDLGMTVNKKTIEPGQEEAKVIARSEQNVRCEVELYDAGEGSTKARIRVGLTGDSEYSHAVFRKIKSKL